MADYDSMMATAANGNVQSGAAALTGAQATSPETGAQAVRLAPQSGLPSSAIMTDPKPVNNMVNGSRQTAILNTNPQMAQWANGDPAHVAASQDDFLHLDALSKVMTGFSQLTTATEAALKNFIMATPEQQKADVADSSIPGEIGREFTSNLSALGQSLLHNPILDLARTPQLMSYDTAKQRAGANPLFEGAGAVLSPVTGALTQTFGRTLEAYTGVRKQLTGQLLSMLVPYGGKGAKFEEAAASTPKPQLGGPSGDIIEGEYTVVHPHEQIADENSQIVSSLKDAVDASKTQGRSPETMQAFIHQHVADTPLENVNVPVSKMMELYQEKGTSLQEGDGLVGDLPGASQAMESAYQTGGNLPVPLGYYLTHFDTEAINALRGVISFGDMPSVEEAKVTKISTEGAALAPPEDASPEETAAVSAAAPTAQAAVAQVKKEAYLNQLFADAKSAGMTETQFGLYSKRIEAADTAMHRELQATVVDQIMKERSADFRAAVERHSDVVSAEYAQRPDVIARHVLALGQMPDGTVAPFQAKLDRADTVRQFGKEFVKNLPSKIFGPNGVGADDVATVLGFRNGEDMLTQIARLEKGRSDLGTSIEKQIDEYVKDVATKRAREEFGNSLDPSSLLANVRRAITAPEVQRLLSDELEQLGKIVGVPFRESEIKWKAEGAFGKMRTADAMNLRAMEKLVGRNGREAEVALLKGKFADAFLSKQRQLLNTHMLSMAHELVKEYNVADRRFRRWASSPSLAGVDQSYLNYVHAGLSQAEYAVKRTSEEIAEAIGGTPLDQFVRDKESEGREIFYEPWKAGKPKEIPVEDFKALNATMQSLMHNGRDVKKIEIAGKKQALEDVLDRFAAQRDVFGDHYTLEDLHRKDFRANIMRGLVKYDASITVPEFLMDKLDLGDFHGVFNEILNTPFQTAKHELDRLSGTLAEAFQEFGKNQPENWQKFIQDKIDVPYTFVGPDGDTYQFIKTKGDLITAALHWGNPENRLKLTEGFGIPEDHMQRAFDYYMKKPDWDFVQMLWDQGENLWQMARDMHGRLSGVKPPSVAPEGFTADGENYRGGHAPVFFDALLGRDVKATSGEARFGNDYLRSLPSKAYTIKRTSYVAPLELDLNMYITRLSQMMQDITHREAILNADKFFKHPSVQYGLNKMIGPEYRHAIDTWIQRLTNGRMMDDKNVGVLANLAKTLRTNMVTAEIGFKISTIQKHGPTALVKSIDEVGLQPFVTAVQKLLQGDIVKNWQDAIAESPELARRHTNMDRDFREMFAATYKKQGFMKKTQQMSLMGVSFSDKLSVVPTYTAARDGALREGESYENAIKIGEKAVRRAHGAGADVDLPALLNQSGPFGALLKTFTPFTTFMNNGYNRIKEIGPLLGAAKEKAQAGDYAGARRDFTAAMMKTFLVGLFPAALDLYLGGEYEKNHFFKNAAKTMAWGYTAGMPLISSAVGAIMRGADYSGTVLDEIINSFVQEGKDLQKLAFDDKLAPKWLEHGLTTTGYLTGLPGARQAGESGQFLWNVITGKEHPHGFGEYLSGLAHGPRRKK